MRHYVIALALILSLAHIRDAFATSRGSADLSIRVIAGLPAACLSVNEKEGIALTSAHVTKVVDAIRAPANGWPASHRPWSIELMPHAAPLLLHPGDCVRYGMRIPGYRQAGETYQLEAGETYSFVLRRDDRSHQWIPDLYSGAFCVARAADGKLTYLPYIHHPDGTMTYPSCGRYAGLPPAPDGISPPRPSSSYPIQPKP